MARKANKMHPQTKNQCAICIFLQEVKGDQNSFHSLSSLRSQNIE